MGKGQSVESEGKGIIVIQTKRGMKHINDVLLVPYLEQNFLCVRQLMEHGYRPIFEENKCRIFDKRGSTHVIASIKIEKNIIFPLKISTRSDVALKMEVDSEAWLWH